MFWIAFKMALVFVAIPSVWCISVLSSNCSKTLESVFGIIDGMTRFPAKKNQPEERGKNSRRWWIYVPVVAICLWIFSEWFLGVPIPQEPVSFEELSIAIHHQDSLMTKQWRKLWAKMPGLVTANIGQLRPGPPAEYDRIHASERDHENRWIWVWF